MAVGAFWRLEGRKKKCKEKIRKSGLWLPWKKH
jgi:hypothetical protein